MCGRVSTLTPLEQIAHSVGARGPLPPWRPRYNQPPGEPVPIVLQFEDRRRIEPLFWGMPSRSSGRRYVNATAERLSEARTFTRQRGLFFVDGFFEWHDKTRQPYYIYTRHGRPLPLAVVYTRSNEPASCAVITTAPNESIARIHNRMPVVVAREAWSTWLDPEITDSLPLGEILRPAPPEWFEIHAAPQTVNSPKNDVPAVIAPDPDIVDRERVRLEAQVRALLDQGEMNGTSLRAALGLNEEQTFALLDGMPGLAQRLGKWWLTERKR